MTNVGIYYDLPKVSPKKQSLEKGDLEKTIKLIEGIKSGQEIIRTKHPDVRLTIKILIENIPSYYVHLNGEKNCLSKATSAFIRYAGVPDFVVSGYSIADEILADYGKITNRKFMGYFAGKQVVEK